jgi:predicted small secreted protein
MGFAISELLTLIMTSSTLTPTSLVSKYIKNEEKVFAPCDGTSIVYTVSVAPETVTEAVLYEGSVSGKALNSNRKRTSTAPPEGTEPVNEITASLNSVIG